VKANINVKQAAIAARRVLWIISLFSAALVLLMLSGCGQETGATTPLPAGSPQASDQPASEAGDSSVSELAAPNDAEAQETSPSPTQTGSTKVASTLSLAGEASLDEFMAKVNERLDLDETQQDQVQSVVRSFLIGMEIKAQQGHLDGQSGQGRQSGTPPNPADGQPANATQMKQGRMGGPSQVTQQLQEVLTPNQLEVFQQLMEELRQEMILQRTIEQMEGATPLNTDTK